MKLLVANRAEIAVRVLATARAEGWATVAVFSPVDRGALHTRRADEAWPVPSYLDAAAILAVARQAGADAVHPGYGFLAENAAFAEAVIAAGLGWIGPPPAAMATMGDKVAARAAMTRAGVPVVPGAEGAAIAELALPILVKAAAGGGGRGMRAVAEAAALPAALSAASAEALAAFGDGRVYAERLVLQARHVEVQVLGDEYGGAVALGVRECSVQRRGQKLIEETPVFGLDPAIAAALEATAVSAAQAVAYVGAGTVEFLLEPSGQFWFLEMNTRIQVEHGVTELVTGLDLVAEQLRLASGGRVPEVPPPRGHAIEARICAEAPALGFRPVSGPLTHVRWPTGPGIRVDAGFESGDEVPEAYDSLVAKVMALGSSRESARRRLGEALRELDVAGVPTTAALLAEVLDDPAFVAGAVHTRWLEPWTAAREPAPIDALVAAWVFAQGKPAVAAVATAIPTPWEALRR